MELTGVTVCKNSAYPLRTRINHRKLVATIFPRSVTPATRDAPATAVATGDQEEMLQGVSSQGMLASVLALLVDGRFRCDLSDRFGRTPLHWAAEQGHRHVVLALLRAGACVDPRSHRKATPITLAASAGHAEVVGVLLQYHAGESDCWPLNRHRPGIENWRSTALHCAAANGHVRVVELLLDAGFDRGQHDGAGLTPAEVSARQSHYTSPAITHLLLPTSDMGGKLVHDYVNMATEDVAMISGLVKGGAFLNWQDENGETPLHRAVRFHHVASSRVLLQAGADPNLRDHRSASPLHVVVSTGCEGIVADLLEAGADMEHRDTIHGRAPLSWACEGYCPPITRMLVEAGADVESKCLAGLTPLHWACRLIDADSVEVLLNAGADPGAVDQAAADAVTTSSSGIGTIVPMPVAIDVIGLGYPLDSMEDSRRHSLTLAARRLDLVSVNRIELSLTCAQQERSWSRRGWLAVLANRQASVEKFWVRGGEWAACREIYGLVLPASMPSRCVDAIVERLPHSYQKEVASDGVEIDSSDSSDAQTERSDGHHDVGKRRRSIDNVVMAARATSYQQDPMCYAIGDQENAVAPFPDLIDALLHLAAVETGLFRRVVVFI